MIVSIKMAQRKNGERIAIRLTDKVYRCSKKNMNVVYSRSGVSFRDRDSSGSVKAKYEPC